MSWLNTLGPNVRKADPDVQPILVSPSNVVMQLAKVAVPFTVILSPQSFPRIVSPCEFRRSETATEIKTNEVLLSIVPNGSCNVGSASNRWNNFYGVTLSLSAKGTSAPTEASDPDNTLTTKKFVEDSVGGSLLWETTTGGLTPVTSANSVIPKGTADLGTSTNKWDKVYANDVYTGDLHMKNERGDWTLIEEEDCLTMTNNKTGKRYAISMTPYTG